MIISKTDIIAKIRKVIDDIAPETTPATTDSFSSNTEDELWQAAFHAVQSLESEMPVDMMSAKAQNTVQDKDSADHPLYIGLVSGNEVLVYQDGDSWKRSHDAATNPDTVVTIDAGTIPTPKTHVETPLASGFADGSGIISLASDFLRFVSLKLATWAGPVYSLIEPGSDDEMRQRSAWGRGTASKPKVLLEYDTANDVFRLRYWCAGKSGGTYDHTIESLYYIPKAVQTTTTITTALKDTAEKAVIYQAAAIFFEGKKESETADKFRNI